MAQRLVVISRDRADQFERFSGASVHGTNVQVIADRRGTERRQRNMPASIEQRRGDRRRLDIDNYLRQVGWVEVAAAPKAREASAVVKSVGRITGLLALGWILGIGLFLVGDLRPVVALRTAGAVLGLASYVALVVRTFR
jgi:hypothetical protein